MYVTVVCAVLCRIFDVAAWLMRREELGEYGRACVRAGRGEGEGEGGGGV